jgi:hypothetical protein
MSTATLDRAPAVPAPPRPRRRRHRQRSCVLCCRPAAFSGVLTSDDGAVLPFALCGVHAAEPDDAILRSIARWAETELCPAGEG